MIFAKNGMLQTEIAPIATRDITFKMANASKLTLTAKNGTEAVEIALTAIADTVNWMESASMARELTKKMPRV